MKTTQLLEVTSRRTFYLKYEIWWTVQTLRRKLLLGANSLETQNMVDGTNFETEIAARC
ncbi:uncharacterized protein Dmoj_GI25584 [Drosophila mojavensis]|uniref:Uncharacterized protein n=1 Tax=Drosophila mojavensis TaxID=7230 RepID=A0A0Q9X6B9_DROMO|nr:uncharacterized protein Dmoj_GI25584 [Drosophila mojavensis]